MNEQYIDGWVNLINNLQQPLQSLIELNNQTIKNLRYFDPHELTNFSRPNDVIVKQMSLALENSHHLLNYAKKSCDVATDILTALTTTLKASTTTEQVAANISTLTSNLIDTNSNAAVIKPSSHIQPTTIPAVGPKPLFNPITASQETTTLSFDHHLIKDIKQQAKNRRKKTPIAFKENPDLT